MSWLKKLIGMEKQVKEQEPTPAPAVDLAPSAPPWKPGPPATDLQAERQALIALIPDKTNLKARKEYANWLESNGWTEDAERLRIEVEREEITAKQSALYHRSVELSRKPWIVFVGDERVEVQVDGWDGGLPVSVALDWKTLDRLGKEILRMAPITRVRLKDNPHGMSWDQAERKVTVMSCDGTVIEGTGRYAEEALAEALESKYKVSVVNYGGLFSGAVASGAVSSGVIHWGGLASGMVKVGTTGTSIVSSGYYGNVTAGS